MNNVIREMLTRFSANELAEKKDASGGVLQKLVF